MRRLGLHAALAAAGVLAAHTLAYSVVHGHSGAVATDAHGYLPAAGRLVVPVALAAFAWLVATGAPRGRRRASLRWGTLAALQMGGFGVQEALEHVLAGHGAAGLSAQPVFWVGLALQLVVAALLVVTVRAASILVGALWCLRRDADLGLVLRALGFRHRRRLVAAAQPVWRLSPSRAPPCLPAS